MGGRKRVHLIRHGKTEANINRLYYGATDLPLSNEGRLEIEGLKTSGCYPRGQLYCSSTLRRTAETLGIIYGDVDIIRLEAFREFDFGEFEMKSYEQLKTDVRYIEWITDDTDTIRCPGGESFQIFNRRIADGLAHILTLESREIVLVTHGGVIASLMAALFRTEKHFYEWLPQCGLGYSVSINGPEGEGFTPIGPEKGVT